MSKGYGIWRRRVPLSAALNRCRRTVGRYWRFASRIVWTITTRRRRDQLEVTRPTYINHPLQAGSCQQPMELEEFINVLGIGDRIRVFCDDGVLVAEKVSQTQFKLIHCQTISELVH